jgi:hypothetical protein
VANPWDAVIKLLTPVDLNTNFTIDVLQLNDSYDVVADVEIGEDLNENVDKFELRVAIINLTTATQVALKDVSGNLTPQDDTQFFDQVRVNFGPIQNSTPGDVLQAVASYRVTAGSNSDVSTAESVTFVVG